MSGWLGEGEVSKKKKKERKMGQNTALKTRRLKKGANHKKGGEKIKAQGTKEDFNKKLHETPKGRIYIYM